MNDIREQVEEVFKQSNIDQNELMSRETLLRFLDSQTPQVYDRIVFEQLYSRMPKGRDGCITIKDYINVMLEALATLKKKIQTGEEALKSKDQQLKTISQKLQSKQQTERYNNNNISFNSKLYFTLQSAELLFQGHTKIYCIIGHQGQTVQSNKVSRQVPVWNSHHSIAITTGYEEIKIVLLDEEFARKDEIRGQCVLHLDEFEDQQIHDLELELKDIHNIQVLSRIKLQVQWIHSESKHFEQLVEELQFEYQELKFDLDEYKNDIKAIFAPFILKEQQQLQQQQQTQQKELRLDGTLQHSFSQTPQFQQATFKENQPLTGNQWLKLSMASVLFYLGLVLICSLIKCVYLDILIIFYCLYYYMNNTTLQSLLHIKIISGMIGISLVLDIIWFVLYTKPWVSNHVQYMNLEKNLYAFEVIISYIISALKLIILLFHYQVYISSPDKRDNIYDEQYLMFFEPRTLQQKQSISPTTTISKYYNYYL